MRIIVFRLLTTILLFGSTGCEGEHEPFDRDEWLQGDYRDRGRMYMSLLQSHPLKGEALDEVVSLIGPPNDIDSARATQTWYLDLGWTALFHMDLHVNKSTSLVDSIRIYD